MGAESGTVSYAHGGPNLDWVPRDEDFLVNEYAAELNGGDKGVVPSEKVVEGARGRVVEALYSDMESVVAFHEMDVAGFIGVKLVGVSEGRPVFEITDVFVREALRECGIFKAMSKRLVEDARTLHGVEPIFYGVTDNRILIKRAVEGLRFTDFPAENLEKKNPNLYGKSVLASDVGFANKLQERARVEWGSVRSDLRNGSERLALYIKGKLDAVRSAAKSAAGQFWNDESTRPRK